MFATLTCLATLIVLNYSPAGGYVHLGDCFVLLSGFILGPLWGGAAAAVGSTLTDLILGAPQYMPATFLIKWGVAVIAWLLMKLLRRKERSTDLVKYLLAAVCGELLMVGGYFAYEIPLYGFAGALAGVIPNLIQGGSGAVLASLLIMPVMRIGYIRQFMD